MIFKNNEIVLWLVFFIILKLLKLNKIRFCYENVTETWICDKNENAKPWIGMKMVQICVEKWTTSNSFDFRIEINKNICKCRHPKKNFENIFYFCQFALVIGWVTQMLILICVPILDTQCQLFAISKVTCNEHFRYIYIYNKVKKLCNLHKLHKFFFCIFTSQWSKPLIKTLNIWPDNNS